MDRTFKVLLIALVVLVVIVPIGLIATGTAFGEWGPDELQQAVGYVPSGLEHLSGLWTPLLPDYDFPGGHDTLPPRLRGIMSRQSLAASSAPAQGIWWPELLSKEPTELWKIDPFLYPS